MPRARIGHEVGDLESSNIPILALEGQSITKDCQVFRIGIGVAMRQEPKVGDLKISILIPSSGFSHKRYFTCPQGHDEGKTLNWRQRPSGARSSAAPHEQLSTKPHQTEPMHEKPSSSPGPGRAGIGEMGHRVLWQLGYPLQVPRAVRRRPAWPEPVRQRLDRQPGLQRPRHHHPDRPGEHLRRRGLQSPPGEQRAVLES